MIRPDPFVSVLEAVFEKRPFLPTADKDLHERMLCARALWTVAFRLESDPAKAEELVQETFTRAWEHRERLLQMRPNEFGNYLRASLKNLFLDRYRHERVHKRVEPLLRHAASEVVSELIVEDESIILAELLHLDPECRDALLLHLKGYGRRDIGRIRRLTEKQVRLRIDRAKQLLARDRSRGRSMAVADWAARVAMDARRAIDYAAAYSAAAPRVPQAELAQAAAILAVRSRGDPRIATIAAAYCQEIFGPPSGELPLVDLALSVGSHAALPQAWHLVARREAELAQQITGDRGYAVQRSLEAVGTARDLGIEKWVEESLRWMFQNDIIPDEFVLRGELLLEKARTNWLNDRFADWLILASFYLTLGYVDVAEAAVDEADQPWDSARDASSILLARGRIALGRGRLSAAASCFERGAREAERSFRSGLLNPYVTTTPSELWSWLAFTQATLGDFPSARRALARTLVWSRRCPRSPLAVYNIGRCLLRLGDHQRAIAFLTDAIAALRDLPTHSSVRERSNAMFADVYSMSAYRERTLAFDRAGEDTRSKEDARSAETLHRQIFGADEKVADDDFARRPAPPQVSRKFLQARSAVYTGRELLAKYRPTEPRAVEDPERDFLF